MGAGMGVYVPSSQHALLNIITKDGPQAAMKTSVLNVSTPVGETWLKCVFAGPSGDGVHSDRP